MMIWYVVIDIEPSAIRYEGASQPKAMLTFLKVHHTLVAVLAIACLSASLTWSCAHVHVHLQ